jgi:DNA polymerase elongation subunit (family B)
MNRITDEYNRFNSFQKLTMATEIGSNPPSALVEIISHTYSTEILDDYLGEESCNLHLWTLNRNSEPYLLRIRDFPIFCYLELPPIVHDQFINWSEGSAAQVVAWLTRALGEDAPKSWTFKHLRKLYYYRGERLYPMILLKFQTLKAMSHCRNLVNKPHRVADLGTMRFDMHEMDISPIRKLFSLRKCRYSQWFRIKGIEIPYDSGDRISHRGTPERPIREFLVAWDSLTPIPLNESRSWITRPRIVSFDIETYSDNHRAFPNEYSAKHVVFMISIIYQILNMPETRQRYAVVYGDCDPIPGVEIIRVFNELDLIAALANLINKLDPEIVTGYNILGFDYPYLDVRLKTKMRDWPEMGRVIGTKTIMTSRTWKSDAYGHNTINILEMPGRLSIDMLPIVRRDYKLEKYDLNSVGKHFIKKGKHDVKAERMFKAYEEIHKALSLVRERTGAIHGNEITEIERLYTADKLRHTQSLDHPSPQQAESQNIQSNPVINVPSNNESAMLSAAQSVPLPTSPPRIAILKGTSSIKLNIRSPSKITIAGSIVSTSILQQGSSGSLNRTNPSGSSISDVYAIVRRALDEITIIMQYCLQDSEIVIELFHKLNVWIGLIELSNIVGVNIMEIFTRGQQIRCKSQIYDKASSQGIVIDRRIVPKMYSSGGFVGEPEPGVHENVICLDFASLYPSIIEAYNLCYTTLVPSELADKVSDDQVTTIEFDQAEPIDFRGGRGFDEDEGSIEGFDENENENDEDTENDKTIKRHYKYKWVKPEVRRGLLPEIVHDLVAERNHIKKVQIVEIYKQLKVETNPEVIEQLGLQLIVLDKRQNALKVSANSIFGFLGAQNGLMPLIEGGMCITAMGRQLIAGVNKYIIDTYSAIIQYNDTDSSMIDLHLKDRAECNKWGNRLAAEINGTPEHEITESDGTITVVPAKAGLFPPPLRVEFEKAMRLLILTKKKYAYYVVKEDGEFEREKTVDGSVGEIAIYTKGIVLARRDNCAWLRKVYRPLLNAVLDRQAVDTGFELITNACADLLEDKVPVVGNLTMIRELGSNYKAKNYFIKVFADELRAMGKPANPGDRLEYVVVKSAAEKLGVDVLLGKKMRSIEMYLESVANAGSNVGQGAQPHAPNGQEEGIYPPEDIDYEYYIGNVLMNPIDQLFEIGYRDVLPRYNMLQYKAQHSRLHPVSVGTPVKMIVKMMDDLQRGPYTIKTLGPVIRSLGPWFKACKEVYDAQCAQMNTVTSRVTKLRISG